MSVLKRESAFFLTRSLAIRFLLLFVILVAAWTVLSTVYWVVRSYTPVPTWDMWTGYVDFSVRAREGEWRVWWANHNEHRLLIPKFLFYLDFWLFKGRGIFLLCATILTQACCAAALVYSAEEILPSFRFRRLLLVCGCLIVTFSWQQRENLTWAFQIQFVLVYAFALLACLVFAKAVNGSETGPCHMWLAVLLAICSAISMASGLLVLPMFAFWALWINGKQRWAAILTLASALMWWAYFSVDYSTSGGRVTLDHVLAAPMDTLRYVLAYLGASVRNYSLNCSMFFGCLYALLLLWLMAGGLRRHYNLAERPLFWFALFVLASGLVVAIGRVQQGAEQAMSSRYATPVLLGWCCLMFQVIACAKSPWSRALFVTILTVHTALVAWQQQFAREVPYSVLFLHRQAALSLALQAHDREAEGDLLWDVDFLAKISTAPQAHRWTVFGVDWLAEPSQRLGKVFNVDQQKTLACPGEFESLVWRGTVLAAEGWQAGWQGNQSAVMLLLDEANRVVGAAVSGKPGGGAHRNVKDGPKNPGWAGYVTWPAQGRVRVVMRQSGGDYCQIGAPMLLPARPYQ